MKNLILITMIVAVAMSGCTQPIEPPQITLIDALDFYTLSMQGSLLVYDLGEMGSDEQRVVDLYSTGTMIYLTARYNQEYTPDNVALEKAFERATAARDAWTNRVNPMLNG